MNTHLPIPSKSPLHHRPAEDAEQPPPQQVVGAPNGVAEGVPSSVRPDPHADDGRRPVAWLHIVAPPSYGAAPSVRSRCSCGRDLFAAGRARALALIADHAQHRTVCSRLTPRREEAA
ncbi:hypothetical protein Snoj_44280 [Streptomyces nojiriensis]|uniref:Uncharacterized protein n=1 Tax=Streptomyces nojiriensis TaxID=66374 RepID=A0ABQ3SQX5_9ACTN|nr:hypothetical protein GCM10010205_12940 [Streptomyces nojiriensis]GHI70510.1 hypothetical protein Snoj_44280 [Streptomyces nojiriensis]